MIFEVMKKSLDHLRYILSSGLFGWFVAMLTTTASLAVGDAGVCEVTLTFIGRAEVFRTATVSGSERSFM